MKIGRKAIVGILKEVNKENLTQEDLHMAKKEKP